MTNSKLFPKNLKNFQWKLKHKFYKKDRKSGGDFAVDELLQEENGSHSSPDGDKKNFNKICVTHEKFQDFCKSFSITMDVMNRLKLKERVKNRACSDMAEVFNLISDAFVIENCGCPH
ncbi:unnamed protein product [Gordionus sp. m RMFG-2023]